MNAFTFATPLYIKHNQRCGENIQTLANISFFFFKNPETGRVDLQTSAGTLNKAPPRNARFRKSAYITSERHHRRVLCKLRCHSIYTKPRLLCLACAVQNRRFRICALCVSLESSAAMMLSQLRTAYICVRFGGLSNCLYIIKMMGILMRCNCMYALKLAGFRECAAMYYDMCARSLHFHYNYSFGKLRSREFVIYHYNDRVAPRII